MASDAAMEELAKKRASYKLRTVTVNGFPVLRAVDKNGKVLGEMTLDTPDAQGNRVVRMVEVQPEVRRQGIAKALWNLAQEKGLNPAHSTQRSAAGDAWARSVGGAVPKQSKTVINTGQALSPAEIAELNRPRPAVSIRPPVSFANMGLGAANVLGFLPALAEAGNIATGRSRAFDNVRMMR